MDEKRSIYAIHLYTSKSQVYAIIRIFVFIFFISNDYIEMSMFRLCDLIILISKHEFVYMVCIYNTNSSINHK